MVAQRRARGDLLAINSELGATILVDEEAVPLVVVPFRYQALGAMLPILRVRLRCRWPYPTLQRKAFQMKLRLVLDDAVGTAVDDLLTALVAAVD